MFSPLWFLSVGLEEEEEVQNDHWPPSSYRPTDGGAGEAKSQ